MNTTLFIQQEKEFLRKAEQVMLHHITYASLSSVEKIKYKELVERVTQGEFEFLNEAPEE